MKDKEKCACNAEVKDEKCICNADECACNTEVKNENVLATKKEIIRKLKKNIKTN